MLGAPDTGGGEVNRNQRASGGHSLGFSFVHWGQLVLREGTNCRAF